MNYETYHFFGLNLYLPYFSLEIIIRIWRRLFVKRPLNLHTHALIDSLLLLKKANWNFIVIKKYNGVQWDDQPRVIRVKTLHLDIDHKWRHGLKGKVTKILQLQIIMNTFVWFIASLQLLYTPKKRYQGEPSILTSFCRSKPPPQEKLYFKLVFPGSGVGRRSSRSLWKFYLGWITSMCSNVPAPSISLTKLRSFLQVYFVKCGLFICEFAYMRLRLILFIEPIL